MTEETTVVEPTTTKKPRAKKITQRVLEIPQTIRDAIANESYDEETGELIPSEGFEEIKRDSLEAVCVYGEWLREQKAYRDMLVKQLEDYTATMKARIKSLDSFVARREEIIIDAMTALGIDRVECPSVAVLKKAPSTRVIVDDEALIPSTFMTYKIEQTLDEIEARVMMDMGAKVSVSVNKTGIKNALESGATIEGAHLEHRTSLKID